jgi:hypothetical protein
MVGDKSIHRTVDVEMWHTDGRSDESLKIWFVWLIDTHVKLWMK